MKLHFDPNQDFQIQAISSVVDLFEEQPLNKGEYEFSLRDESGSTFISDNGLGNNLVISEEKILKNLQQVQTRNGLYESTKLEGLNFSLEMETGTGKTYVYLRTIYELNKKYGFKKFIIVVPSVAIREGVLKNLEITGEHFQNLYEKVMVNYQVYDSGRVSTLRNFALSNSIQILVINIDSFAKDINIINKTNDKLTGKKPIEFIQSTRPMVIVDEPQNMETNIRKKAVLNLNPLCTLRYSATHTNLYNLIYSLNPVKAYDLGLVKQIEVDSIFAEGGFNQAFVLLEDLKSAKTKTTAKIRIDMETDHGVLRKSFNMKVGDDLYAISNGREAYKDGYKINSIDVSNECIELSNGDVIYKGETRGGLRDEIMRVQMEKTIEEHFKKEKKYKRKGIKVLSLFFIDRVANYRSYDKNGNSLPGKFAVWFEKIFKQMSKKSAYKGLIPFDVKKVHNGYFAQDKKGVFKDSFESRETQSDNVVYKWIMKDKEILLDISNPLRFIFSHSALREGWDNPNVFQICTLNETKSEMKKRQEIGRGLRLSVNQEGDRIKDKSINVLTVVANESYEDFAKKLQKEIHDDCGVEFTGRIKKVRDKVGVRLKKGFELDKNFLDLWNRIKQKTTYRVNYSTKDLIKESSKSIRDMQEIARVMIKSIKVNIQMVEDGVKTSQTGIGVSKIDDLYLEIPDVLGYIQSKTELTRSTILNILKESGRMRDILKNPQTFLDAAVNEIKNVLNDFMVDGIKYEKIGGSEYAMMLFGENEIEFYIDNLYKVKKQEKTITTHIVIDSMSQPERKFAEDCESNENIEFFIKLPHWFVIKTPIGNYNPDWALIFKNDKKLYFVAETKSTLDNSLLRIYEEQKIRCSQKHFEEFPDVKYKQVTKVSELL
ncbi:MAG: DEAD/DEAH box helicase family protein [Candidatus Firestonebacteria bacterium]